MLATIRLSACPGPNSRNAVAPASRQPCRQFPHCTVCEICAASLSRPGLGGDDRTRHRCRSGCARRRPTGTPPAPTARLRETRPTPRRAVRCGRQPRTGRSTILVACIALASPAIPFNASRPPPSTKASPGLTMATAAPWRSHRRSISSRERPRTKISPSPAQVAASIASARRSDEIERVGPAEQISHAPCRHLTDAVAGDDGAMWHDVPERRQRRPVPAPCIGSGRTRLRCSASSDSLRTKSRGSLPPSNVAACANRLRRFRRIARQGEHVRMLPALSRAQDRECHDRRLVRKEHGDGDRHRHDAESGARNDHRSDCCRVEPVVDGKQNAEEAGRHGGEQNGRLCCVGSDRKDVD